MSKWNKPQGVVVPLESLLKERRKENCPAPRRSAGLVGRWGITSFTSIRSRSYGKDMMESPRWQKLAKHAAVVCKRCCLHFFFSLLRVEHLDTETLEFLWSSIGKIFFRLCHIFVAVGSCKLDRNGNDRNDNLKATLTMAMAVYFLTSASYTVSEIKIALPCFF